MGMGLRARESGRDRKEVEVSRSLELEKLTLKELVLLYSKGQILEEEVLCLYTC